MLPLRQKQQLWDDDYRMSRPPRIAPGGVCFHVINRSARRDCTFGNPDDYQYLMHALQRTQEHLRVDLLAACLMPNHFHLVLRPKETGDLSRWMQLLTTTHVRWHHGRAGTSRPLWQGRYKSFPIEQDAHLLTVMRYVERNALRANIVDEAQSWRWGSLNWRLGGPFRELLCASPIALPRLWVEVVNAPQSAAELNAVRVCVNRERPFGGEAWVECTVSELGLSPSLAPRGRPRKRRDHC